MRVTIRKLVEGATFVQQHDGERAIIDLFASEDLVVEPGAGARVSAGLAIDVGPGVEARVEPLAVTALPRHVSILTPPGVLAADERRHLGVALINDGQVPFRLRARTRIARLVLRPASDGTVVDAPVIE